MPRRDPFDLAPARSAKKSVPFPFVLDELAEVDPVTRPMFGCLAVYAGERIVLILRDKPGDADNGVWIAFSPEHQRAVAELFPRLEPIAVFADKVAGWKKLPARSEHFEDDVMAVCALIRQGDERIGKIPGARRPRAPRGEAAPKAKAPKAKAPKAKAPGKVGSAAKKATAGTSPRKGASKGR